jgi:O-antigen ligase
VLLAAAVGEAVLYEGGFKPGSRVIFGLLAGAALIAAFVVDRDGALRAARQPVAVILWALAALGALSAFWTVGLIGDTLRWSLVTFGYGAVFVAAVVLMHADRRSITFAALGICALATASGLVGIVGAAAHSGPFADYTRGVWTPGGTLEYANAMSLLAVSALPVVLLGMCARSTALNSAASFCGAVCAAVLALGGSRAEIAFALIVCEIAVAVPAVTVRCGRPRAAGAVAMLCAMAIGAHVVAGGQVSSRATPQAARTLLELALACLVPGAAWVAASAVSRRRSPATGGSRLRVAGGRGWIAAAAAVVAAAAIGSGAALAGGAIRSDYVAHIASGGFWHGRLHLWREAIDTAEQRPVIGAGADAFLSASITRQRSSPVRFAHDLPLEEAVELGGLGLALAIALYVAAARAVWRSLRQRAGWLLAPAVAAFLAANLIDWPWHLAGSGAIWALALGGCATLSESVGKSR